MDFSGLAEGVVKARRGTVCRLPQVELWGLQDLIRRVSAFYVQAADATLRVTRSVKRGLRAWQVRRPVNGS